MSVMEADEQDRGTILHYAPRHVRLPAEERSIRPILERLSRGENDSSGRVHPDARLAPTIPLELPRPRIGRQILLCSILSAGLSAGLAVAAVSWLTPVKTDVARVDSVQLDPKLVRTVSFKPQTEAFASKETDLQKPAPEAAPPIQPKDPAPPSKAEPHNDQIAPKELLALWSGIPADVPAAAPVEAPSPDTKIVDLAETARDEAEPVRDRPARSKTHRRLAQLHRKTHTARLRPAHAQQRAQARAASTQNRNATPAQSPLQSLFSRSAAAPQQSQQAR